MSSVYHLKEKTLICLPACSQRYNRLQIAKLYIQKKRDKHFLLVSTYQPFELMVQQLKSVEADGLQRKMRKFLSHHYYYNPKITKKQLFW